MIQDIKNKFDNSYYKVLPRDNSYVLSFEKDKCMIKTDGKNIYIPRYAEIVNNKKLELRYLFSIDNTYYFLSENSIEPFTDYDYEDISVLRNSVNKEMCFAAETAFHLYNWYRKNKFCGACGVKIKHRDDERVLFCPSCGNTVYPCISPAIIVGVVSSDRILMTKYAGRDYKKYALIAGFCEVGETAEDTVRREVMEEVGIKIKNIKYYKSQPWGFNSNMLFGFFAELDGNGSITIDKNELSEAKWVKRSEMNFIEDDGVSLTREMIGLFKNNKVNFS
ncbi:MAG: NAD(+) diphosphatase [Clostridia bacterium]|nr:NAD(+) diphosphatase [Clostridia bacterium]MCI1999334.1 NAD(+) diphosphatase [Clostridia bacterium]MCI2015164.1 NAD(+) diphosphatase [Clostridia bacterium]